MNSSHMKKPDIIIVDDHQIFRQGLKGLIAAEDIGNVVGVACNGIEFLELLSQKKPDIVLMDINMPYMNGFEAIQKALVIMPDLKVIAFTMFGDYDYYFKMIDIGAKGFLLKSCNIDELEKAIKHVLKGERYFAINLQGTINNNYHRKNIKEITNNEVRTNKKKGSIETFVPWFWRIDELISKTSKQDAIEKSGLINYQIKTNRQIGKYRKLLIITHLKK